MKLGMKLEFVLIGILQVATLLGGVAKNASFIRAASQIVMALKELR